jgi:hypothetical protein
MLDFEPNGNAVVHFEITGGDARRREIRLPLADYVALAQDSRTLEELLILLFEWRPPEGKSQAASA